MKDFLTVDFIAAATAIIAFLYTIISSVLVGLEVDKKKKRELEQSLSKSKKSKSLHLTINGKSVEVNGEEKDVLSKVLNIKGGENISINQINVKSEKKK